MKKYKLIKEYPGSPELGTVVNELLIGYIYGNMIETCKENIENSPEFWEEIIEINYKIVKCRPKSNYNYVFGDIMNVKFENGRYYFYNNNNNNWDFYSGLDTVEVFFKNFNIYAVERLSDGKVFTIGDRVKKGNIYHWKNCLIESFNLKNDKLTLTINQEGSKGTYCFDNEMECVSPMFVTEDGVDIFDEDEDVILVNPSSFAMCYIKAGNWDNTRLVFKHKESVRNFILQYKTSLSLHEIFETVPRLSDRLKTDLTNRAKINLEA